MKSFFYKWNYFKEIFFSIAICWFIFYVPEESYAVPRLYWLYLASFMVLIYVADLRNITIVDYVAWIYVLFMVIFLALFWKTKGINADNYGDVFSKVLRLKHINYMLFVGLILDLFRHKPVHMKSSVKSPLLWLYILVALIGSFFAREDLIPLVIPIVALLLTDLQLDKWSEVMDCLGIGYYVVFFYKFTYSLLFVENGFFEGRYFGGFANLSTTGVHASIAVIWGIYYFIRWLWADRKKIYLFILLPLWSYSIVMSILVNSRTAEFGLLGSILAAYVFLHGKGNKETVKRLKVAALICVIGIFVLVLLAYVLKALTDKGVVSELSYGLQHIMLLACSYEDGYFESELLNKLNAFSSQRLIYWAERINQVGFVGINAEQMDTHNVYLYYIIRYGYIGGGAVILWALTYIAEGVRCTFSQNKVFIMPLLYGVFAFLNELGMNGYWKLPLGFYWLIFSYPLIVYGGMRCSRK